MYLVHYCEVTKMGAYADVYLNDVVEVQGKLFDFFAQKNRNKHNLFRLELMGGVEPPTY